MIDQLWWAPGIQPGSTHHTRLLIELSLQYLHLASYPRSQIAEFTAGGLTELVTPFRLVEEISLSPANVQLLSKHSWQFPLSLPN